MDLARGLCPTSAASLYTNLGELYTSFHYPPSHIWNCDESGVQAGRSGGATVLARTGSRSVHCIEPDQREHLLVLSCINADGGYIPNFYILKGTYFRDDYVKRCEENVVMAMQPNAWMTRWLFQSWISHFIACLKRGHGIDQDNRHLLILDGHNSHVPLEVVTVAMGAGLDIISLPSYTSHALQPLDVSCFKPFKTAFRQTRDSWTLVNKGKRVEKQDLCEWTAKALLKSLNCKNIKSGFKKIGIWPLNPKAVAAQMAPSQGFEEGQESFDSNQVDYTSSGSDEEGGSGHRQAQGEGDEEGDDGRDQGADQIGEQVGGEATAGSTKGKSGWRTHFYVDVLNQEESSYTREEQHTIIDPQFRAQLQEEHEQDISHFLALPEIIPAKKRKRQQPFLDYTRSRILTSTQYMTKMEQLLAQKEAVAVEAKKKKEEKEATKEQQRQKTECAQARAAKKATKDLEKEERDVAVALTGRRGRGWPARADTGEGRSVVAAQGAVAAQGEAGTCSAAERRPALDQIGSDLWAGTLLPLGPSTPTPTMTLPYLMQSSGLPFLMHDNMLRPPQMQTHKVFTSQPRSSPSGFYPIYHPPPGYTLDMQSF
jgi:hypothetical protein